MMPGTLRLRLCVMLGLAAAGLGCGIAPPAATNPGPQACADFLSRTGFDVSVMDAELMNPGADTEYCWVDAMIRPNIRFAASLPTNWNGRFVMRGGGGYAGQQPVKGRDDPLRDQGYVTASTDTGHDAARYPLASFAYDNRDGEIDYAYRAVVSRGEPYFPGQPLGAELGDPLGPPASRTSGWGRWFVDPAGGTPLLERFGVTFMRYMAFHRDDPDWSLEQFDFDEDPYRMDAIRGILDATEPDLTRFRDAGGRMITYHGWSDTALNPLMAVNYYDDVLAETPDAADFYRLFMVPGMFHCGGGRGINTIDALPDLVAWVETDEAPARLIGERAGPNGEVLMTRPVCPYPEVARYTGSGDLDDAASFVCRPPSS